MVLKGDKHTSWLSCSAVALWPTAAVRRFAARDAEARGLPRRGLAIVLMAPGRTRHTAS